jgi:hypothetical protein
MPVLEQLAARASHCCPVETDEKRRTARYILTQAVIWNEVFSGADCRGLGWPQPHV